MISFFAAYNLLARCKKHTLCTLTLLFATATLTRTKISSMPVKPQRTLNTRNTKPPYFSDKRSNTCLTSWTRSLSHLNTDPDPLPCSHHTALMLSEVQC